jgi:hypothetical protein
MIDCARSVDHVDVTAARLLLAWHIPAHDRWDQHSETVATAARHLFEALPDDAKAAVKSLRLVSSSFR